jgi:hypothetical protein
VAAWQRAIYFVVGDEHLPLDLDQARRLVEALREVETTARPEMAAAATAAAVFVERLLDEAAAENPPMTGWEAGALMTALELILIRDGLPGRMADLRDALRAQFGLAS